MWDCGACGCQAIAASLDSCPMCYGSRELPYEQLPEPEPETDPENLEEVPDAEGDKRRGK